MYLLLPIPPELHTLMDFVVLTSLPHPREKNFLVVLQIGKQETGKAKDLSASLSNMNITVFC
jgi:hypothetical protein